MHTEGQVQRSRYGIFTYQKMCANKKMVFYPIFVWMCWIRVEEFVLNESKIDHSRISDQHFK